MPHVTVERKANGVTIERSSISYGAALLVDWRRIAAAFAVLLVVWFMWAAGTDAWSTPNNAWAYGLVLAMGGGVLFGLIQVESHRRGWVVFVGADVVRVSKDTGTGWLAGEIPRGSDVTVESQQRGLLFPETLFILRTGSGEFTGVETTLDPSQMSLMVEFVKRELAHTDGH